MSGFYKKAVVWLGLNEEYSDHDVEYVDDRASWEDDMAGTSNGRGAHVEPGPQPQAGMSAGMVGAATSGAAMSNDPLKPAPLSPENSRTTVRPVPLDKPVTADVSSSAGAPSSTGSTSAGTVRAVPMAETSSPTVVIPQSFNNAQDVADIYKESTAVVVDLTNAERDLARRLIDFAAGLCYGLGGKMEKVTTDVYLLIPEGVEVSDSDRKRFS